LKQGAKILGDRLRKDWMMLWLVLLDFGSSRMSQKMVGKPREIIDIRRRRVEAEENWDDPHLAPCGRPGVLYTMHEEGARELWYLTASAIVYANSDTPSIIGLAGSWIATTTEDMHFNLQ
jgi:hypothetical protein